MFSSGQQLHDVIRGRTITKVAPELGRSHAAKTVSSIKLHGLGWTPFVGLFEGFLEGLDISIGETSLAAAVRQLRTEEHPSIETHGCLDDCTLLRFSAAIVLGGADLQGSVRLVGGVANGDRGRDGILVELIAMLSTYEECRHSKIVKARR